MRALVLLGCCLLLGGCDIALPGIGRGDDPATIRAAAEREGRLTIWSSTDLPAVGELLADFRQRNPRIRVDYHDLPARRIDGLVAQRMRDGGAMPDVVWTTAMDLQIKLVNDGHTLRYASPERGALPAWANWKDEAWGITAEPVVMVYNRRLIAPATAPASHADLLRLLEGGLPALRGRVATYDVANSAVGYLYLSQDVAASRLAWPLVRALGANGARLFSTSEQIISDVSAGRSAIGYNVLGSYAVAERRRNPDLTVVLPRDYTLIASRIAVIPARAAHPNAARTFLDYLLSRRGQSHLAARAMPSVRRDVAMPPALRTPEQSQRAIRVGPALLVLQDRLTRRRIMAEWNDQIGAAKRGPAAAPMPD